MAAAWSGKTGGFRAEGNSPHLHKANKTAVLLDGLFVLWPENWAYACPVLPLPFLNVDRLFISEY
jgi:hypothetical protein